MPRPPLGCRTSALALAFTLTLVAAPPARAQDGEYTLDVSTWFDPVRLTLGPGVWHIEPVGAWNPWGFIDLDACSPFLGTCLTGWTTRFEYRRLLPGEAEDDPSAVWESHGVGVRFWNRSLALRHAEGTPPLELELTGPASVWLRAPLSAWDGTVAYLCPAYPNAWCPELGPAPEPPLGEPELDPGEGPPTNADGFGVAADPTGFALRVRVERVGATTAPEPSTLVLVAAGLAALLGRARRATRAE
jgi:hypothetical protein